MTTERQRAEEIIAYVKANDPTVNMTEDERREYRAEKLRASLMAQEPILDDLRDVGIAVDSVWDVVSMREQYPQALPILMKHLHRGGYPPRVTEAIARAMAVRPAITYWDDLLGLYRTASSNNAQDGLAIALAGSADKSKFDALLELLSERQLGSSRILLLSKLLRLDRQHTLSVLPSYLDDPGVMPEVQHILNRAEKAKRRKENADYARALRELQGLLDGRPPVEVPNSWVEWSTSLDAPDWEAFAAMLKRELGGEFHHPVGRALLSAVDLAPPGVEDSADLRTELGPVRIGWFIDDVDVVDVALFGPEQLSQICEQWMNLNGDTDFE